MPDVLRAPEGEAASAGGGEPGATPDEPKTEEVVPAWATALIGRLEAQDKRLGDQGRQLARLKGVPEPEPKAPQGDKAPVPGVQAGEVAATIQAAMRFGELRATLPEQARAKLDEMQAEGRSYGELVAMADLAASLIPESPPEPSNGSRPRGYGATPPPPSPSSVPHPKNWTEYAAIKQDPKAFERLSQDPSFDSKTLLRT